MNDDEKAMIIANGIRPLLIKLQSQYKSFKRTNFSPWLHSEVKFVDSNIANIINELSTVLNYLEENF